MYWINLLKNTFDIKVSLLHPCTGLVFNKVNKRFGLKLNVLAEGCWTLFPGFSPGPHQTRGSHPWKPGLKNIKSKLSRSAFTACQYSCYDWTQNHDRELIKTRVQVVQWIWNTNKNHWPPSRTNVKYVLHRRCWLAFQGRGLLVDM